MSLSITRGNFDEWMTPIYALAPFIPVRGEDSRLWDRQGRKCIDFTGDITVNTLGHAHPTLREVLSGQTSKFWHMGDGYTNEPILRLAKKLIDTTFAERIFFCNSGAEASEAALKLVRKYAHDRFDGQKSGIIAFKNTFHGCTLFTVSIGGQPVYSQDFALLPPDIRHVIYNDLDSVSQLIDGTTCVVIVEPVQGEGGVVPVTKAFLQGLRELCDRHNALLIFDEVQTGVGRTGELYVYMHYGITPDLLTTAKVLSSGSPIGALLTTECCVSMVTVDTHGTTYDGNPLAAAVAGKLLEIVNTSEVFNGAKQRHDWLVERINATSERFGLFSEICGFGPLAGCMLNAEFTEKAKLISQEATITGVMILIVGANVVHFAPTFNVSEEEVVTGLGHFALACEYIKARGSS